jgi:predicted nucleic acid-binding protein
MDYVTDTHSLVWYFTEDSQLSKKALRVFEGTIKKGIIIIPAVVLAEVMFIAKKGKIILTFEETPKRIETYENFDIAPLDVEILRVADKIEVDLEMHDKLIVATALYYNAALVTKDRRIKGCGACSTIW